MKKFLLMLVAFVGFGFAASAQEPHYVITDVSTTGTIYQVTVKIANYKDIPGKTYYFKVKPVYNSALAQLFSSTLIESGVSGQITTSQTCSGYSCASKNVYFKCTDLDGKEAPRCRTYDFEVVPQ